MCPKGHERPLLVTGVGGAPKAWAPLCCPGRQATPRTLPGHYCLSGSRKSWRCRDRSTGNRPVRQRLGYFWAFGKKPLVKVGQWGKNLRDSVPKGSLLYFPWQGRADISQAPTVCLAPLRKMRTGLRQLWEVRLHGMIWGPQAASWFPSWSLIPVAFTPELEMCSCGPRKPLRASYFEALKKVHSRRTSGATGRAGAVTRQ